MLYGIAVVVIAAVIFLIVYNLKAGQASKPPGTSGRAERNAGTARNKDAGRIAPELQKSEAAETAFQGHAASSINLQPAQNNEPKQPPKPDKDTLIPHQQPDASIQQKPSDDEYRQALRSFSAADTPPGTKPESKDETAKTGKDEAYREGLRSLAKRD